MNTLLTFENNPNPSYWNPRSYPRDWSLRHDFCISSVDYQDGSVWLYKHGFCSYRHSFYPADGSLNLVFDSGDSFITQGKRTQKSLLI